MLRTLGVLGTLAVLSCTSKRLPHSGEEPVYPLRGLHAAVACAECHGPGIPSKLPVECIACHALDSPSPDHYPGQDCGGACHIEDGWEIVEPPTPTIPGFDHSTLPEDQLCWECHEVDRKDENHYAYPDLNPVLWWDCSGCHGVKAWNTELVLHPTRIPHGSVASNCDPIEDDTEWVTGCVGCHPNGTQDHVCFTCHDSPEEPVHDGIYAEDACLGACHEAGEPIGCAN